MDQRMLDIVNVKVIPEMPPEEKQVGILLMLEIASALLTVFRECKNLRENVEKDAPKVMRTIQNPGIVHKARLYMAIKRQCRKNGIQKEFETIVTACLKAGEKATLHDIKQIAEIAEKS